MKYDHESRLMNQKAIRSSQSDLKSSKDCLEMIQI